MKGVQADDEKLDVSQNGSKLDTTVSSQGKDDDESNIESAPEASQVKLDQENSEPAEDTEIDHDSVEEEMAALNDWTLS